MPNDSGDFCTPSAIGYSPADVMTDTEGTQFSTASVDSTKVLTKVMILHPIATGIAFIAFLLTLGAGVIGSLFASIVSLIAFVITVVVLITDFVLFSIIKSNVNDDPTDSVAFYSTGLWTLLAAAICILLATIVVFFTCCSSRFHRNRQTTTSKVDGGYCSPTRRRRWF